MNRCISGNSVTFLQRNCTNLDFAVIYDASSFTDYKYTMQPSKIINGAIDYFTIVQSKYSEKKFMIWKSFRGALTRIFHNGHNRRNNFFLGRKHFPPDLVSWISHRISMKYSYWSSMVGFLWIHCLANCIVNILARCIFLTIPLSLLWATNSRPFPEKGHVALWDYVFPENCNHTKPTKIPKTNGLRRLIDITSAALSKADPQ